MTKYNIGILVMATLVGCMENANKPEIKIAEPINHTVSSNEDSIPAESIFQLTDVFQTQENKIFRLSMLRGKPTVVVMIFTHCSFACPRLTLDIKNIADSLKDEKEKVNFLLVSFDTKRDTPDRLKTFANEKRLNKNWILLHGSEDAVRTLSVLLNVQFEKDADGIFSHNNLVSVLDKNGVLHYQKEGLGAVHIETIAILKKLIQER